MRTLIGLLLLGAAVFGVFTWVYKYASAAMKVAQ